MTQQARIAALKAQIGGSRDGALLRYALARALLEDGRDELAIHALREALKFDASYSAAWKDLGRALHKCGDNEAAAEAFRKGIAVAEKRGDVQAGKEMRVFLRRIERETTAGRTD